jgi:hypothetical protein
MALDVIVSDTGPLISLEKLSDGYGWIQQLFRGWTHWQDTAR